LRHVSESADQPAQLYWKRFMHKVGYTLRLEKDMHVALLVESIKEQRGAPVLMIGNYILIILRTN
jgi:hypothetical protein